MYKAGDILFFDPYVFTDSSAPDERRHFALALAPNRVTSFERQPMPNSIYCAVITSQVPRRMQYAHLLAPASYQCFSKDSYACLDRIDMQSLGCLGSGCQQPLDKVIALDAKKIFKKLKAVLYSRPMMDPFMRATIFREWKKLLPVTAV